MSISQGSPLLPILYLFYNTNFIKGNSATVNYTYINDIDLMTVGLSIEYNIAALKAAYEGPEGMKD